MKPDPLLDAFFQPDEKTLGAVLTVARRRRLHRRLVRVAAGAACILTGVSFLFWRDLSPSPVPRSVHARVKPPAVEIVSTRPLRPDEVVHTRASSVAIVTTVNDRTAPTFIADDELLALFRPGHVAVVGSGEQRRLIEY